MPEIKFSEVMRKRQTLSFEVFPPKTEKGFQNLKTVFDHLKEYRPEYISVTYGAGGSNIGANRKVCSMIRGEGITPMTHFSVVRNRSGAIKEQLNNYLSDGIDHVLALRGDLPNGEKTTLGDFQYASQLVEFIRSTYGDRFEIAVAGMPEGHVENDSMQSDIGYLKLKQDCGADYIMTQLCWDPDAFERWLDAIRRAGVTMPVDVGIMPLLSIKSAVTMALSRNGCVFSHDLARLISKYWIFPDPFDSSPPFEDDQRQQKMDDFRKAGIEYTIKLMERYRTMGISGFHMYALNRWKEVAEILDGCGYARPGSHS